MANTFRDQFRKETGIDLSDTSTAGKFAYYNTKKQAWTSISRGEGWRRYAEWLETEISEEY